MLPEQAIRHAESAIWLEPHQFFTRRVIALLQQTSEYKAHYAALGMPLNLDPHTLTGEMWLAAMDAKTEQALGAIY